MWYMFALALGLVLRGLVVAADADESLRLFLAKSDVVVVGEFTTEPIFKEVNQEHRHYQADFKVTQAIKWEAPGEARVGEAIDVHILLEGEEPLPEMKKGGKCLLFLECRHLKPSPSYITADFWFAVQRPHAGLVKSLTRIVSEQNNTPLRVPAEKEIELFYPDPVRPGGGFQDFTIGRADLVKILRDYQVIPKQDWKYNYSHVALGDRTGAIVLRNGTRIQYMVRPGGLATLTYVDGRKLFLASTK